MILFRLIETSGQADEGLRHALEGVVSRSKYLVVPLAPPESDVGKLLLSPATKEHLHKVSTDAELDLLYLHGESSDYASFLRTILPEGRNVLDSPIAFLVFSPARDKSWLLKPRSGSVETYFRALMQVIDAASAQFPEKRLQALETFGWRIVPLLRDLGSVAAVVELLRTLV